ncbi:hypothetical protein GCM10022213_12320 [Parerythrobacter jejuensis]
MDGGLLLRHAGADGGLHRAKSIPCTGPRVATLAGALYLVALQVYAMAIPGEVA